MTLEAYRYASQGTVYVKLTECPVCDHEFGWHERRDSHFLEEHRPEDFGLSPLGETPADHREPLFTPADELPEPAESPPTDDAPRPAQGGHSDD